MRMAFKANRFADPDAFLAEVGQERIDEWYALHRVDPQDAGRGDFQAAAIVSALDPDANYKAAFYPVSAKEWAEALKSIELAGDTESPMVLEERLRMMQHAEELRKKKPKESSPDAKPRTDDRR
jgi:hypothetical protein